MSETDLDTRLADEVTALSTKLVTEVAKSSHLEEVLLQLRRENAQVKARISTLEPLEKDHEAAARQLQELSEKHEILQKEKSAAEAKNKQLEGEVEDLTASLFNEANEMVSNASREAYNYKIKNRKLIEELAEKDSIIDNLQEQLRDLKGLFVKMEEKQKSRANTPRAELSKGDYFSAHDEQPLQQFLFAVRGRAVRFDLPVYQTDFKAFVCQLIKPDFSFDLASLKTLKYFRKLWAEEIEPCVPVIPGFSGNNFMNRWTKGKSFWGLLAEGKAIIEPMAGVNETFKLTYKGAKKSSAKPVAVKDACAFCGENKDDLLEHARLYNLKLYGPATETGAPGSSSGSTTEIGGEPHSVVGTYPLCNFCLVKLRAICTFFARLRLMHKNIYKLPQNSGFDDVAYVNNFQFKRSSESLLVPAPDPESEPIFVKLYLMLLVLRAKIFWSRIGFWDTNEDVQFLNLDEIPLETFRAVVQDNVAFKSESARQSEDSRKSGDSGVVENGPQSFREEVGKDVKVPKEVGESEADVRTLKEASVSEPGAQEETPSETSEAIDGSEPISEPNTELSEEAGRTTEPPQPGPRGKKNKKKGKKAKSNSTPIEKTENSESTDSTESTEKSAKPEEASHEPDDDNGESEFQDSVDTFDSPQLQRRKSKSKEFKAKIDKDLASTMAALQESLE